MFNYGNLSKEPIAWKLGRVSKVKNARISIVYSVKSNGVEQTLVRSIRDVSILYSVGEMMINTVDHFYVCVKRENPSEN